MFHLRSTVLYNWQYLFIIEGILTVLVALVAWFWLPDGPGSAWFLSEEDRLFAVARIAKDHVDYTPTYRSNGVETIRLTNRDITETAKDWKMWYVLVFNICASVPNQTFSVFLPLVVQGLGYSSIEANLVSIRVLCSLGPRHAKPAAPRCQSRPMSAVHSACSSSRSVQITGNTLRWPRADLFH